MQHCASTSGCSRAETTVAFLSWAHIKEEVEAAPLMT